MSLSTSRSIDRIFLAFPWWIPRSRKRRKDDRSKVSWEERTRRDFERKTRKLTFLSPEIPLETVLGGSIGSSSSCEEAFDLLERVELVDGDDGVRFLGQEGGGCMVFKEGFEVRRGENVVELDSVSSVCVIRNEKGVGTREESASRWRDTRRRARKKRVQLTTLELVRIALALLLESTDPLFDGSRRSFGVCFGRCWSRRSVGRGRSESGSRSGGWEFGFLGG